MAPKLTLCQYYDAHVRELGYKCWNTFVALEKNNCNLTWVKKQLKRQYKGKTSHAK